MKFGLIIIGDEILNGRYVDAHFAFTKQALLQRGLRLAWVEYVADVHGEIVSRLKNSFAAGIPVFVTGGIGATPDDHTRQAAADALGVDLSFHPEAVELINTVVAERLNETNLDSPVHQQRLEMAKFPTGSAIIPNPFNQVAGFSIAEHYFLPGFPVMAHPMIEWVLENYYQQAFFRERHDSYSAMVYGLQESQLAPLMIAIELAFTGVQTFSLPKVGDKIVGRRYRVEWVLKPVVRPAITLRPHGQSCANRYWRWVLKSKSFNTKQKFERMSF